MSMHKIELTDLEICLKIAEIEKPNNLVFDDYGWPMIESKLFNEFIDYNPLKDEALCFDLMVKHGITFSTVPSGFKGIVSFTEYVCSKDPQRVICLAVISKNIGKSLQPKEQGQ